MTNTIDTPTETWAQMRARLEREARERAFEEFEDRTYSEERAIRERKRRRPVEED
jgi:hypothetical protein